MFKNMVATAWMVMWALAGAVFVTCKGLTWWLAVRSGPVRREPVRGDSVRGDADRGDADRGDAVRGAPWWRHAGYLLAWPGLDAVGFLTRGAVPPTGREWMFAAIKTAVGVALVGAAAFAAGATVAVERPYVIGWIAMVGLTLTLHFGVCHLLSCAWRRAGVDARPLMDRPLAAASVGEFWSRRWNTAYRDVTHRVVFRPLASRIGTRAAIVSGFVVSGVVHDLVISVPARGGYGGPTLFFILQAIAVFVERSAFGRRVGLGHGLAGRVFTASVLLLPLYVLFHRPFVERIVVPFMEALGA